MYLYASTQKNPNVVRFGYVFLHVCGNLLGVLQLVEHLGAIYYINSLVCASMRASVTTGHTDYVMGKKKVTVDAEKNDGKKMGRP